MLVSGFYLRIGSICLGSFVENVFLIVVVWRISYKAIRMGVGVFVEKLLE